MYVSRYLGGLGQHGSDWPVALFMPIEQYEALRAQAEDVYISWQRARAAQVGIVQASYEAAEKFGPSGSKLLPSPSGAYIKDPNTGYWWRAGNITQVAWQIQAPGTPYFTGTAAEWIARVEASRQPGYGTPETLPERLGWDTPITPEEQQVIDDYYVDRPTEAPPPYVPPPAAPPPPPAPPPYVPPPAAPPPAAPAPVIPPGNVAPVGSTPPGHRYPILPYAPHGGTAELRAYGWPPDVIGFWLYNAFGGDLELTEAFLLSFANREALDAWIPGKGPADTYARADAALAARRARPAPAPAPLPGIPPPGTQPPGIPAPAPGGIGLPVIALGAAALIFLWQK